jgi:hypothetical protein
MMLFSALTAVLSAILWLFGVLIDFLAVRVLALSAAVVCIAVPVTLAWIYRRRRAAKA